MRLDQNREQSQPNKHRQDVKSEKPLVNARYSWRNVRSRPDRKRRARFYLILAIGLVLLPLVVAGVRYAGQLNVRCLTNNGQTSACYIFVESGLEAVLPPHCPPACAATDLQGVDLSGYEFRLGVDFHGANLSRIILHEARLHRANLSAVNLYRADLKGASLIEALLPQADLHLANLVQADLSRANLEEADVSYADLFQAKLAGATLRRTNLAHADLAGADLTNANLREADLRQANLQGANLYQALFFMTDLRDADLARADLRRADLREAQLDGTNLQQAWYNDVTKWPPDFDPEAAGLKFQY